MTQAARNLIVWDWNGTLLADSSACLRATNSVLAQLGVAQTSMATYRHYYTMPFENTYAALGVDLDIYHARKHELHPQWHAQYSAQPIRLRRGAKDVLSATAAVCTSVVLSNYLTDRIDAQARQFGIRDHINDIVAFQVGEREKAHRSKGEKLHAFLNDHRPERAMIVGDSEEEVVIGRELGFTTVAITHGTCSTARLRAARPDYIVGSLPQVAEIAARVFALKAQVA